ncbi:MAG: Trk family potassium uptake protein [Clostridiales bacterium]|nr:Trk family potassium uptake protein [Clostridiales bacterium]
MKIILLGYCFIILLGTVLLRLPAAMRDGSEQSVLTAFFTATSSTCVTGLVRADTCTNWTLFGQAVILVLIQTGGIGFMTICISALSLTKKNIGLASRSLMQNSISAPQLGGIVRMTKFISLGTFLIEGIGALLLAFYFCPLLGLGRGIWYSVFHSISAFCNAGFDLMGIQGEYSSLTSVVGNWYVNLIIMLLIVIGGLGFFVWRNLLDSKFQYKKMLLHTRIVMFVTAFLILGGALLLFLTEHGGAAYHDKSLSEQIAASFFQSVSARTAGFNTVELARMTEAGRFILICLMMIGGSAGSTAGGIKTTTFAVLMLSIITTFRHRKSVEAFGRRMEDGIARTASCVFMMYLLLSCGGAVLISRIEGIAFLDALFETVSAIATVGLSVGLTPTLGIMSCLILCFLMIFGRVGSMTMLLAFSSNKNIKISSLPLEKVQIG